ncbi:hypothetical protein B0J11DRAFT_318642 [Dendryphion nanum]|uniref:Nephrocystin 3-like N-terminal domain-containing protein n=1 Tax=Dendryphion nanum TaxID=256645 RepID=A0A9P9IKI2_9PLEO|nr:hypothetical protein B0J11DRAFT_318642 [Dendryphion nanum]
MADIARRIPHALAMSHGLSSDIFPGFFGWFFDCPIYERWSRKEAQWQLHCIGGPGSGKTTLASLVANELVEKYQHGKVAIVSLFVQKHAKSNEISLFEDMLVAILHQLLPFSVGNESNALFEQYEQERYQDEGCRSTRRIQSLREILYILLSKLPKTIRTFLILDGIDLCTVALRVLLENELFKMQEINVSVMLTSRVRVFEKQRRHRCDHLNHGDMPDDDPLEPDERENLDLFWKCKICSKLLCFPCREAGRACEECHFNDHLHEPYAHQNISIDLVPRQYMEDFISWNLEREHGDLGLSRFPDPPPLSALGQSILEGAPFVLPSGLVEDIYEESEGNISIAKARLDLVHVAESWAGLNAYKRRQRLPVNIVSMFDAGIRTIQQQRSERRELGLKAISVLAKGEEIPITIMRRWLSNTNPDLLRSGEDIIDATEGFLCAIPGAAGQDLCAYHNDFFNYATNHYNEAITSALSQVELEQRSIRAREVTTRDMLSVAPPILPPSDVRFEPMNLPDTPTRVTQNKLARTVTMTLDPIEENTHVQAFVRKGTVMWS